MPGEDPSLVPAPGGDASTPIVQPNNDAALFAERALFQCMGFSPQQANQMAESCNGLYNQYKQYLPGISLSELANSEQSDPFMADAAETNSLPSDEYNEAGTNLSSVDGGTSEDGSESTDIFGKVNETTSSSDALDPSAPQDLPAATSADGSSGLPNAATLEETPDFQPPGAPNPNSIEISLPEQSPQAPSASGSPNAPSSGASDGTPESNPSNTSPPNTTDAPVLIGDPQPLSAGGRPRMPASEAPGITPESNPSSTSPPNTTNLSAQTEDLPAPSAGGRPRAPAAEITEEPSYPAVPSITNTTDTPAQTDAPILPSELQSPRTPVAQANTELKPPVVTSTINSTGTTARTDAPILPSEVQSPRTPVAQANTELKPPVVTSTINSTGTTARTDAPILPSEVQSPRTPVAQANTELKPPVVTSTINSTGTTARTDALISSSEVQSPRTPPAQANTELKPPVVTSTINSTGTTARTDALISPSEVQSPRTPPAQANTELKIASAVNPAGTPTKTDTPAVASTVERPRTTEIPLTKEKADGVQHATPEQYAQTNKPSVFASQSSDVHLTDAERKQSTPAPEKIASTGNPAVAPTEVAQLNRQASVPATDAALLGRHAVGAVTEGTPSGAQLLAEETATTKTARGVAFGTPGADVTTPLTVAQLADASNPNIAANNLLSANQMIDAMQKNTSLSRDLSRENNLGLVAGSSPLSPYAIGYPPGMQIVDATGKSIADNIGLLSVKESGAIYNASTTNLAAANPATANLGINGQSLKEGQMVANATTSQGIAQALQGLLQQGQGASISKLDETGKAIVKGAGAPALTEGLVPGQSGKKGSTGPTEGTGSAGIGMPLVVTTKGGSIIDGSTEITLPVPQTGNVTNTGIIITATAGATTTGQTGTAGTTSPGTTTGTTTTGTTAGTTGTGTTDTTTNPVPGTHDPNATDIKSLVTALPTVHIIDTKKGDKAEDDATGRPEIDYDSIENNDLDNDDDYIDRPVIETRRSQNSAVVNAPKKSANIGLTIIENIMVLINDLKNQKVDDLTARRMWADLFTDLFGKQKRQPCAIRADDTLENIARFVLKDPRLAPLLYTINVHTKNIKPLKGYESLEEIGAIKPETNKILLPHRSEILRYKIHVLKEMSALVLYAQGNKIADRDFSAYTCRAGDTLKSIAASHIDVRDENMWADIALLNGLSVRVDKTGSPIAQLKEGQLLQIPKSATQEECEEDDDELAESSVKNMSLVSPIANLNINFKDEETVNKALATMEKRIISQSDLGSGKDSVLIKLELREGSKRMKVAEWNVNATSSNLKLYDRFGGCKIISIALPTRAARELAENDLKANAEHYCKMFLTGELAA